MTFFLDNCISKHFAEALRAFNIDVVHLQDEYQEDAEDKIWIPKICRQGLIIVTCDQAQTKYRGKTAVELNAYQKHRGRAFFLPKGFPNWLKWKQVACFFRCWESIVEAAPTIKKGQIFDVSESGKISPKHIRKI